ncbi:MAG: hypothetical protein OHK0019_00580 [Saprospiraceae bacterium]
MKYGTHNPKPQKNLWAVVFPKGAVATWTIAWTKRQAIQNYTKDADWIKDKDAYWEEQYKKGTRCVKINITFQIA